MPSENAAPAPAASILVVDDDVELCELVSEYLVSQGLRAEAVHDGATGLERALSGNYSLIVLDVMLPGIRGFEVLRKIRAKSSVPVVMLTAHGDDVDRIVGLEIGADDYLSKPFNPRELAARIHAVLRRSSSAPPRAPAPSAPDFLMLGDLEVDARARVVRHNGRTVPLTSVEFELLSAFSKLPGQVIPRGELGKRVLGSQFLHSDRKLDVHISNLRKKLGPAPDGSERIRSIRNVGYIYVLPGNSF
ncbi:MAG: response regulator transcription factor [Candidatus Acidiferrales bacterium]